MEKNKEILREYVKFSLETEFAKSVGEDVVEFSVFYANTKEEFIKNIIVRDFFNMEDMVDEMKEDGYFEEDEDIKRIDLLKHVNEVEKHLENDECVYKGKGFYDFWSWGWFHCERIDDILEMMKGETDFKVEKENEYYEYNNEEKRVKFSDYTREIEDEEVENRLEDLWKLIDIDKYIQKYYEEY